MINNNISWQRCTCRQVGGGCVGDIPLGVFGCVCLERGVILSKSPGGEVTVGRWNGRLPGRTADTVRRIRDGKLANEGEVRISKARELTPIEATNSCRYTEA